MTKRIISFFTVFILLFVSNILPVSASSTYCYINGEKHFITQRNVYHNGQSISLASEPALVVEGYNYIPAKAFISQMADITYSYQSSSKKITITNTKTSDVLILSLNSKTGTFNGKSITLSCAPVPVSFTSGGDYSVYIPAKDTASYMGLSYSYSNSGKKILYTSESGNTMDDDNNDYTFKETITLSRPSTVSKGTISCTDDYHNKRLVITIPGNYTTFYNNNKPSLPSGVSFSHSYSSSTGKTSLIFITSSINGWRIKETSSKILIMNGKPTNMFKNVIVLDPGHGGSDPGACYGNLYKEADFTLGIVKAAARLFEQDNDYKVYCTRLSNTLPSGISKVWDRRTFANNLGADIFVSVHINSSTASSATGTETLYNSKHNVSNSGGLTCYKLASIVQTYIQAATGFKDRGVKVDSTLSVLLKNNNPAVLTEIGFISNLAEAKSMAANLDSYGEALYNAIVKASCDYPTGR
ncbi:MAG: hypothetical protein E7253_05645 [Lachnospiraceae bacterium]|nr:hypothetical protein [Lachnospiraceae bacterium]